MMSGLDFLTEQQVAMLPDLPVKIEKERQMTHVPFHQHEFIEIAFVAAGSALHRHRDSTGRLRIHGLVQGDLFSIQVGEAHSYEHCESMTLYNLFLKPESQTTYAVFQELPGWPLLFGERTSMPELCIHLSASVRSWAIQCLTRSVREFTMKPPGYGAVIQAQILEFLAIAMRTNESNHHLLAGNCADILESISLLEEHPEKHFNLEQLAGLSHMSVPAYTKKFRVTTGLSPMEYLFKIRLQQVRHYLATSDFSIGEIAEKCGFCTPNYLIKLFRREQGVTPGKYRKELFEKAKIADRYID